MKQHLAQCRVSLLQQTETLYASDVTTAVIIVSRLVYWRSWSLFNMTRSRLDGWMRAELGRNVVAPDWHNDGPNEEAPPARLVSD